MNAPFNPQEPAFHEYANLSRNDAAPMLAKNGCIYCIGPSDARVVKIGWSQDPEKRLRELQTGNPDRLEIHAIFPASQSVERGLHDLFKDLAVRGEWFLNEGGEVVSVIKGLLNQFFPEVMHE